MKSVAVSFAVDERAAYLKPADFLLDDDDEAWY